MNTITNEIVERLYLGEIHTFFNDALISHRSFRKVFFNPILRGFGIEIASYYTKNKKFTKYIIQRCPRRKFSFLSKFDRTGTYVIRKKLW